MGASGVWPCDADSAQVCSCSGYRYASLVRTVGAPQRTDGTEGDGDGDGDGDDDRPDEVRVDLHVLDFSPASVARARASGVRKQAGMSEHTDEYGAPEYQTQLHDETTWLPAGQGFEKDVQTQLPYCSASRRLRENPSGPPNGVVIDDQRIMAITTVTGDGLSTWSGVKQEVNVLCF